MARPKKARTVRRYSDEFKLKAEWRVWRVAMLDSATADAEQERRADA